MQIPVLIEPVAGNRFRARGGEPLPLTAEGATREEALVELRKLVQERLAAGGRLVSLDLPVAEHTGAPFAGMFKDDPLFDEWQEAIAEYRRQRDADPDVL